jgi:Carboxypeptidase regulatory-like domain
MIVRRPPVLTFLMAVIGAVAVLPDAASAQSAIAGVVRDASGGVPPGVNVEASSEVLIEKTRSVVTDGAGQYKIVDLRPGTYIVTFTLPGFTTIKRENVQLPAEFTSTINAEMKVGTIEESITVSAESPVVDVTTAVHTQVLSREAIDSIPTGRTIQGMGQLIVGISLNLPDTGGARAMQQTYTATCLASTSCAARRPGSQERHVRSSISVEGKPLRRRRLLRARYALR